MATTTTTSRISIEKTSIDLPQHPLVNPHPPVSFNPSLHVGATEGRRSTDSAVSHLTRRVSSESSKSHGRASPSSRVSRRTPVPFLLEAFPTPPSHIPPSPGNPGTAGLRNNLTPLSTATPWLVPSPGSTACITAPNTAPATCGSPSPTSATFAGNPPPSLPPTSPLPPIPGPSPVTPDLFIAHRALQNGRSASPALSLNDAQPRLQSRAEQVSRTSLDSTERLHGRGRKGSLSSLRKNPALPSPVEEHEVIHEEPLKDERLSPPPPTETQSIQTPLSSPEITRNEKPRIEIPELLAPSLSRAQPPPLDPPSAHQLSVEDSIANVDMSDLTALKSDNEGELDDHQASHPFPQFPPLLRSQPTSPTDYRPSAPPYGHTPRKPSRASIHSTHVFPTSEDPNAIVRAASPEVTQMISSTPRPRKRSAPSRSRAPSLARSRSSRGSDVPPVPNLSPNLGKGSVLKRRGSQAGLSGDEGAGEDEGNGSDSSIDLHTPLPHLMLRHGMLSPNSKLLPQADAVTDPTRLSIMSSFSSASCASNGSNISLLSTMSTSSKHPKDARDTPKRRVRHRDGKMLKGGIGLTTGLGWSDSEDEDAPSPLTRRVSTLVLSQRTSSSSLNSFKSSHSQPHSAHPLSRSISHHVLREVDEPADEPEADEFGYPIRSSLGSRSLPSRSQPVSRAASTHSASSLGRFSHLSISSTTPTGNRARADSASGPSSYRAISKTHSSGGTEGGHGHVFAGTGLALSIPEQDDGITPTRAVFERSSLGSMNGGASGDLPHTPSSTASSTSLSFPATPKSGEDIHIPKSQALYNQDKRLPPLPANVKGKYPSTLSLRSQAAGGLPRPRTFSNTSSVSACSMLSVPGGDTAARRSPSPTGSTSTPRPSSPRASKTSIPVGSPRPSINGRSTPASGVPRPVTPKASFSAVPRPITPSPPLPTTTATAKSSATPNANGTGYTPRPLRLVSRSSTLPPPSNVSPNPGTCPAPVRHSADKILQPGESLSRPGQVLTYNRNVHDQLKFGAPNVAPHRTQVIPPSPGGTQTLLIPSNGLASNPNSAASTPLSVRSSQSQLQSLSQSGSPLPSPSLDGESPKPKPRTGTGMMYRNNLTAGSAAANRIRVPSAVQR